MKTLYLVLNFASFIVPFIFSFHPRLAFYKRWAYAWPAIILTAIPFLVWDIYFTEIGVWGFNPDYLSGFNIFNLPLEEVLFFICIPYACLFTYHCLNVLIKQDLFATYQKPITILLLLILGSLTVIFSDRLYTVFTFPALAALVFIIAFLRNDKWLSRFYFAYMILLIPFTIVNGILTGTGLDTPIVWYNNSENMGMRFLSIPFEDVFYGMLLILLNVFIYEAMAKQWNKERSY